MDDNHTWHLKTCPFVTFRFCYDFLTLTHIFFSCFLYSFATGGEDGYVRINNFDQQYFDFEFEF